MVLLFLFPLWLILGTAGLEQAKNLAGESVKRNRHQCESATPSSRNALSFHPRAQRNAFRRRDVRVQSSGSRTGLPPLTGQKQWLRDSERSGGLVR